MEKLIKILTDPVSNRIIQLIRSSGGVTVSEILAGTKSIPRATVYRKIDKMLAAGVIEVAETHKVRGQTENVYVLKNYYISDPQNGEDGMKIMTTTLMRIFELCSDYFKRDDADASRDKLFVLNYAIPLADADFAAMLGEIYAVVDKYQNIESTENSHLRNLYLMSVPAGGAK